MRDVNESKQNIKIGQMEREIEKMKEQHRRMEAEYKAKLGEKDDELKRLRRRTHLVIHAVQNRLPEEAQHG